MRQGLDDFDDEIRGHMALSVKESVVASLMPAARASRVDVLQALRSE
jgi:ABC-type lipoprotein release transport system permease subunit